MIKYNDKTRHEFIFTECVLETLCNDQSRYFGVQNTTLSRPLIINKYLSKHPNFGYLIQNADRLFILSANLGSDHLARQDELTWKKLIGADENDEQYLPLGFALVINNTCPLTKKQFSTIEWIQTFYPNLNLAQLIIDKLKTHLDTILLPRDTSVNPEYWQHLEEKEQFIFNELCDLLEKPDDFRKFHDANNLLWNDELIDLIAKQIDDD